jgi:hypothetical protein
MKRLLFIGLCMISLVAISQAQAPQAIEPGFTTEREIVGADKHSYEVNLNKGEMLNFVVEQRGADVVLRIYAPDGKFYDRVDSPNGTSGEEPFRMVAPVAGRYRVEINPYFEPMPGGKYFVKTVEIRKATETEMKAARLKDELLKIVTEDTRANSFPGALKRFYANKAVYINPIGFPTTAAELLETTTKNPYKPPADFSFEDELSDARVEDFGGGVVALNLRQSFHQKTPSENSELKVVQRIGYVFKREKSEWRIVSVQRTLLLPDMIPPFIKLSADKIEPLVGVYESGKASETLTVTREGDALYGKFPEGEKFMLVPETENVFNGGPGSIAFIRGADGTATHIVIHYPIPNERMIIQTKVK